MKLRPHVIGFVFVTIRIMNNALSFVSQILYFLGGWIFFMRKLFKNYEVSKLDTGINMSKYNREMFFEIKYVPEL